MDSLAPEKRTPASGRGPEEGERIPRGAGVLVIGVVFGFAARGVTIVDLFLGLVAATAVLLVVRRDRRLAVVLAGIGLAFLALGLAADLAVATGAGVVIVPPAAVAAARLRPWAFVALLPLGALAMVSGWHTAHDGRYLLGAGLLALGAAGALAALVRRHAVAAIAVAAVAVVVVASAAVAIPRGAVAEAYQHAGRVLYEQEGRRAVEDELLPAVGDSVLIRRGDVISAYAPGEEPRTWWDRPLTRSAESRMVPLADGGAVLYDSVEEEAHGTVYVVDAEGSVVAQWSSRPQAEDPEDWFDAGVVAEDSGVVVTGWCHTRGGECQWHGWEAATGATRWTVDSPSRHNPALPWRGVSVGGVAHAPAAGFWVTTLDEDGSSQFRHPATGEVRHTAAEDQGLFIAGASVILGIEDDAGCRFEVLRTDADPVSAEADCELVGLLAGLQDGQAFIDGDVLWLTPRGQVHAVGLVTGESQSFAVGDRSAGERVSHGLSFDERLTAGSGVLVRRDGTVVQVLDPATRSHLWELDLRETDLWMPEDVADSGVSEDSGEDDGFLPRVEAGGGVVTVRGEAEPLLLERGFGGGPGHLLLAFDARTGEPLTEPVRLPESREDVRLHGGRLFLRESEQAGSGTVSTVYVFGE